jgi:ribosomal-protein-alanine N-acetyltransferase
VKFCTPHLEATPLTRVDLAEIVALHADPVVMATLGGVRDPRISEQWLVECEQHWHDHGFGLWALRERSSGSFVGRAGLRWTDVGDGPEVEVNYALRPEFWGRGFATEVAAKLVEVAAGIGLRPVIAFTWTENAASERVMQKAGFRFVRQFVHAGLDHVLYRLDLP